MLTDVNCRRAICPPGKARARFSDSQGLYLEVTPKGSRRWFFKYRFAGKERRLAIGNYPGISLKEARAQCIEARALLRKGKDPVLSRKEEKLAQNIKKGATFKSVALNWHADWAGAQTERHARLILRQLTTDVFPLIGIQPISEITPILLVATVKKIESRGTSHLPRRIWQTCSQIFRYAVAHNLIDQNPLGGIKPGDTLKSYKPQNYARLPAREIPGLLEKIESYGGPPHSRLALKLMALTFVRTGELIGSTWDEFENLDGKEPLWRIPAHRMKTRKPHIVPLAAQTIDILADLKNLRSSSPYLFPSTRNQNEPAGNNIILQALYDLGYRSRMTGHGFRGIASTTLHELGWRHDLIEMQLAHQERNQVSASYNHATYLGERRKMMQAWADHLDRLLESNN